jgi:hypothetical protein
MTAPDPADLATELSSPRGRVRALTALVLLGLAALAFLVYDAVQKLLRPSTLIPAPPVTLNARELVLRDSEGRPRVVAKAGEAPGPGAARRRRQRGGPVRRRPGRSGRAADAGCRAGRRRHRRRPRPAVASAPGPEGAASSDALAVGGRPGGGAVRRRGRSALAPAGRWGWLWVRPGRRQSAGALPPARGGWQDPDQDGGRHGQDRFREAGGGRQPDAGGVSPALRSGHNPSRSRSCSQNVARVW